MRYLPMLLVLPLGLASCSQEEPMPVDTGGGMTDRSLPETEETATSQLQSEEQTAATMPVSLRGQWREDDLAREPTQEDCNQTSDTNRNFGKVLTVRAKMGEQGPFTYSEVRIVEGSQRHRQGDRRSIRR